MEEAENAIVAYRQNIEEQDSQPKGHRVIDAALPILPAESLTHVETVCDHGTFCVYRVFSEFSFDSNEVQDLNPPQSDIPTPATFIKVEPDPFESRQLSLRRAKQIREIERARQDAVSPVPDLQTDIKRWRRLPKYNHLRHPQ